LQLAAAGVAPGPAGEEHGMGLFRPVDLGWHAAAHSSRALCGAVVNSLVEPGQVVAGVVEMRAALMKDNDTVHTPRSEHSDALV
jgi:hypothetical protein